MARVLAYPTHRCIKAHKAVQGARRLTTRLDAWRFRHISFAELNGSVNGWMSHMRYADSWRLRAHMLSRSGWGPEVYGAPGGEVPYGQNHLRPRYARYSGQRIGATHSTRKP